MNNHELKFIQQFVQPRLGIIEQRSNAFEWNLSPFIPGYLLDRAQDIKAMYLMGLDNILGKFLPIFMEDILINIAIGFFADYHEQVSVLQNKYERKHGWEILDDLRRFNVLCDEDEEFCSVFYGAVKVRNNEVHNKELAKFKSKDFVTINSVNNESSQLDPFYKSHVMNTPWLMRALNTNALVEEIPRYTTGTLNLLQRNVFLLSRPESIGNKEVFASQKTGEKFIVSVKKLSIINALKQSLELNQLIDKINEHNEDSYLITAKRKITALDVNLPFGHELLINTTVKIYE